MCRLHIQYPTHGPYSHHWPAVEWADDLNEEQKREWDEEWDSDEQQLNVCLIDGEIHMSDLRGNIETIKADEMFVSQDCMSQCVDCQPLIFKTHYFDKGPECNCNHIYGHFCKEWRCIPCILVEEAKLVIRRQKMVPKHPFVCNGEVKWGGVGNAMPSLIAQSIDKLFRTSFARAENL